MLPSGERELSKAHFGSTVPGKTQRILEVLSPENRLSRASATAFWKYWPFFIFPGTVLPFCYFSVVRKVPSAFWKYCSQKNVAASQALIAGERSSAYRGRALQRWPNFTFFIFPGTVLPFFYFSVVRKVPEKPVLFLPHPNFSVFVEIWLKKFATLKFKNLFLCPKNCQILILFDWTVLE